MIISNNSHSIPKEIGLQGIFPHLDVKSIFSLPRVSKSYKEAWESFEKLMKGIWSRRVENLPFTTIERELNPAIEFTRFVARLDHLNGLKASIRRRDGGAREGQNKDSILSWDNVRGMTCLEYRGDSENLDQVITGEVRGAYLKADWIRNLGVSVLREIPSFFSGMAVSILCIVIPITINLFADVKVSNSSSAMIFLSCLLEVLAVVMLCFPVSFKRLNFEDIKVRKVRIEQLFVVLGTELSYGLPLFFPQILKASGLKQVEWLLFLAGSSGCALGILCGPKEVDVGQKMVSFAKGGIVAIKLALKICLNILKKMWEYRTAILTLAVFNTFCHYNTTANALVAPFYRPVMDFFVGLGNKVDFARSSLVESFEGRLLFTSLCSYAMGYLSGPVVKEIAQKVISLVKILMMIPNGLVRVEMEMTQLVLKICLIILKKMWEYRSAMLLLSCFGLVCYKDPRANAIVAPYYRNVMELLIDLNEEAKFYSYDILDTIGEAVSSSVVAQIIDKAGGLALVRSVLDFIINTLIVIREGSVHFGKGMEVLKMLLAAMVQDCKLVLGFYLNIPDLYR